MKSYTFLDCLYNFSGTIYDFDRKISLTSKQFCDMVESCKEEIEKLTNRKNMFVLLTMGNSLNFMVSFFGILSANAIPIIASKNLSSAEIEMYYGKCKPNIIMSDYSLKLEEKSISIYGCEIYYSILHEDDIPGTKLKDKYGVFILHPTSGTTGESRLCLRDEKGCIAEPLNHIATTNGDKIRSMLCMLPLNHAYGFGSAFLLGMLQSYNMHLISDFNPRKIINILVKEEIDYMPANPVVLDLLLRTRSQVTFKVPRYIISAGSILKRQLVSDFHEKFGIYVKASYGSTETGEICLQRMEGVFPEGCVGHPLKKTKIDIRKIDGIDILLVNNPSLMNGYLLEDFTVDSSLISSDGFYPTKDIALLDNVNMVTLCGRLNDVINLFGVKIIPQEIEAVISSFQSVKEVYVYGKTNEKGYEEINAVIDTDCSMEVILDLCRKNLRRQMIPQNIFLQPLRKTETGKILREQLP